MQPGKSQRGSIRSQTKDAEFLANEFDMQPKKAAGLVAREGADPDEISAKVAKRQKAADPLKDVPTPHEPARERVEDVDEVRLKPVLHERNDRAGGA
jgi:hypothetical protein